MEKTDLMMLADRVHQDIGRYMLADGLNLVIDFGRSQGSRIYNSKTGEMYLDFFGCFATIPLGYNNPSLCSDAVIEELGRVAVQKPSNSDLYSVEMADFVTTFGRIAMPSFAKYLFFIEGGTLAVENALKVAFDWKVRQNIAKGIGQEKGSKVIHFRQAFHGRSGYTLSLTNTADPRKTQYFPKFNWPRVLNPKCKFPLEGGNLREVLHAEETAIGQIKDALWQFADDVACIILEPIQGEGGDNHFRPEFHLKLREICDESEILLIYDEVQTGLGSTGKMWAFEHFVEPDIIAFGKKTQVCGVMAGPRIDTVTDNVFNVSSRINSTWGGNLVDMVRCRMYLEAYEREAVVDECRRLGNILISELEELQSEFPAVVSNVRGRGLFCALDLPNREFRDKVRERLFEKRLIILGCGDRSIRFRTALNIPQEDLVKGVEIIRRTLHEFD